MLLQSAAWKKLQDDLGEQSFFETGKGYHFLAIKKSTPTGNYLYLPYGPEYETKSGFKNALESLKSLAKAEGAVFIRIEPRDPFFASSAPKNAKKSKDLNPKETWVLDLTGNDDDFKARLPSRLLRYHKNAAKNGLSIETSKNPDDIKHLLKLQKTLASEKGISTFSESYLKTELKQPFATLYLAKHDGHVVAAGLVFDHDDTRYNLQGAQSDEGKKLHATGILTIQLIAGARKKGLKTFDFWGIAPEGAPKNHPWSGFTNFKKTFAGSEVAYAGTYDLVLRPARYTLYKTLRKLRRLFK